MFRYLVSFFRYGQSVVAAGVLLAACAPATDASEPLPDTGQLELALTTSIDGEPYELQGAVFEITGAQALTLNADADSTDTLLQELPVGEYSVALNAGWQLVQINAPDVLLDATLISDNPLPFTVASGETTPLQFRFTVLDPSDGPTATGQVALGIDVVKERARALIFSELMSNPAALGDAAGEWIELTNVGKEAIALGGCKLLRDGKGFSIESTLSVEPGESVALANGEAPGFTPTLVYSSVTLPNSAVFSLELQCQGVTLDQISVDPSSWPGGNGIAASLSPSVHSSEANDDPAVWCDATQPYATDLGTPGAPNPTCP